MTTSDMLHPGQLRMFMRPAEVKAAVTDSVDVDLGETMKGMWGASWRRPRSSRGTRLSTALVSTAALRKEQVEFPVQLHTHQGIWTKHALTMGEGHHRVAAAHTVERASRGKKVHWLPVEYSEF